MAKETTQIELIEHYSKNLLSVIESFGPNSDKTTFAFFQLQAAKINVPHKEMNDWSSKQFDKLHQMALDLL